MSFLKLTRMEGFFLVECEISVALMKGTARMFERFVCTVPAQNGQRYLGGFAVPAVPDE